VNTKRKRNLMVFLRPTIIRDGKTMNELSKEKYNFIRAEEIRKQEDGLELMSTDKLPLLPKWNDALILPPSFDKYLEKKDVDNTSETKNN